MSVKINIEGVTAGPVTNWPWEREYGDAPKIVKKAKPKAPVESKQKSSGKSKTSAVPKRKR